MNKYILQTVLLLTGLVFLTCSGGAVLHGRVVANPERWRNYYDFYIDTDSGRKKISILGSGKAPYDKFIRKGWYISIKGVDRRKLKRYIIEVEEKDIDIDVSLLKLYH